MRTEAPGAAGSCDRTLDQTRPFSGSLSTMIATATTKNTDVAALARPAGYPASAAGLRQA
jgi:hypothetical protein